MPAPTSRSRTGARQPSETAADAAAPARSRPRSVPVPRWALACVVGCGLVVLVLATTAEPVSLLNVPDDAGATGRPPGPLATPFVTASTMASASPTPDVQPYDLPWVRPLVLGVLIVIGILMLAGTVVAVVHVARRLWADRWQVPDVPESVPDEVLDVDLAAHRDAVTDVMEEMRRALSTGSPRNAVVQCWLLLVQSLERHGVSHDPAQSPTEFTRYALGSVTTDRAAVRELTALFLEARFSEHPIGESARHRAERALARVVDGLDDGQPRRPAPSSVGADGAAP